MKATKIYKKILKAFGGYALYLDKAILQHLGLEEKDEVCIELLEDSIIIKKSTLSNTQIEEMLKHVKESSTKRI